MKLTTFQIGILAIGTFASVVALSILGKAQSDDAFRSTLRNLTPSDLLSIRTRRVAEERMEAPVTVPDQDDYDNSDNEDTN